MAGCISHLNFGKDCVCEACGASFDDPVDTKDGVNCPYCGSTCVLMVEEEAELFDYEEAVGF